MVIFWYFITVIIWWVLFYSDTFSEHMNFALCEISGYISILILSASTFALWLLDCYICSLSGTLPFFLCVSDQLMRLNGSWSSVCGRVYHFVSNISANNYEILAFFPTPNAQQSYFCNTTCTVNKMRYGLQNMIIKNKQQILGKVITYYCTAINNPICKTRLIGMQCVRMYRNEEN